MDFTPVHNSSLKKASLVTPGRKNTVTFNNPVITNIIENYTRACDKISYQNGSILVKILSSDSTEDSTLIDCFKDLKDNIFFLDKKNERITAAVLSVNWTQKSNEVVSVYQELILNIVSAHPMYLPSVLAMIINIFSKAWIENDEISKEENECYQKAHSLLQAIIKLVPLSLDMLCTLLRENFPYIRKPSYLLLRYCINMLNITTYVPSHRLVILGTIIDNILQIDVYCPRDTIETWELEKEENKEETVLDMDMEPVESLSMDMAYPLANTLDQLMCHLLRFLDCTCYNPGKKVLNWDITKKIFREILTIFDSYILTTYRCSHVQFLLFYLCSWKPALCEGFVDYLWKKIKNPNTAPIQRQMATFYIGSLLARASFISINTAMACFDLVCDWIHRYINSFDSRDCSDVSAHGTFYCVCQMVFYVFAFRHKEFINMRNGFKNLRNLNFERIVTCRLNPLKFCQHTIVQNFASIARNYQIVYCYPVIERNNRSLTLGTIHTDNFAAMNCYFPFDPYLLKRSKTSIDPIYRMYERSDNEEHVDREEDETIAECNEMHALFSYGSSPGFKKTVNISSKVR